MDGGDDNVCKAIEDLIKDSKDEGRAEGEAKRFLSLEEKVIFQ